MNSPKNKKQDIQDKKRLELLSNIEKVHQREQTALRVK
jgi:hypothetical protein